MPPRTRSRTSRPSNTESVRQSSKSSAAAPRGETTTDPSSNAVTRLQCRRTTHVTSTTPAAAAFPPANAIAALTVASINATGTPAAATCSAANAPAGASRAAQPERKAKSKDLGTIQPPGGAPLVLWIGPGGTKLNADALSKTSKRLEARPKEDLAKWVVELERITDKKLDSAAAKAECLMWFVNHVSVAFDDVKWNAKTADNLFKRAQTMPPADAKAWKEAFEALVKSEIGKAYAVPLVLIPVEALHEGQKYSAERGKKYLARMEQLTADDVSLWKNKVDEFGGTELDAAVNIILLDDFFEKENFQRDKFKAAVEAKKK